MDRRGSWGKPTTPSHTLSLPTIEAPTSSTKKETNFIGNLDHLCFKYSSSPEARIEITFNLGFHEIRARKIYTHKFCLICTGQSTKFSLLRTMHIPMLLWATTLLVGSPVNSLSIQSRSLSSGRFNDNALVDRAKTPVMDTSSTSSKITKNPQIKQSKQNSKQTKLVQQAVIFSGYPGIGKTKITGLGEYKGYTIQDELGYKKGEEAIFLERVQKHAALKEILLLPAHPWVCHFHLPSS